MLLDEIRALRSDIAVAAQSIYDAWNQDEHGVDDAYGAGGICDDIAQTISGIVGNLDNVEIEDGGWDGDEHAWIIVVRDNESVGVDIAPNHYEYGGGYSWTKRHNVTFTATMVDVWTV